MRRFRCTIATVLLAVGASFAPAAAQNRSPDRAGEIVGQVVGVGEVPVSGTAVQLDSRSTTTDSAGLFRFENVAPGRHVVRVVRAGLENDSIAVSVEAGKVSRIRIHVTDRPIVLASILAEAVTADSARARGAGFARGIITRTELALWETSAVYFGDVLRVAIPSVRIRRLDRLAGSDVCIELRSMRAINNECLMPAVYLDGVPILYPASFFASIQTRSIERVEIVPAAEAGVRFGSGALYGAILIDSRRPGLAGNVAGVSGLNRNFDWDTDPQGHRTVTVFATAAAANAAGAALGFAIARSCIHLRLPARDALRSDCNAGSTVGAGLAAVALPAIASGLASRLAGQTRESRGILTPATVGAAMSIMPGYAFAIAGQRSDSQTLQWIGYGLITVGAPIATTAADYLFRTLRR